MGEPVAHVCHAQTPQLSCSIRAPGLWRSRVGAREVGARRVGLFLQLPPHPSQLFSCYLCSGKRCLLPRLRGKAAARDLACACPCPALGLTIWEQVGGRVSHSLPLCGHFGPQHQPKSEALGGEGREPLRRVSCGLLFSRR